MNNGVYRAGFATTQAAYDAAAADLSAALASLGQHPEIAALAGRYLALCIPCLFMGTAIEVRCACAVLCGAAGC